jgi:ribosomal protein L11 methyltransferase
VTPQEGQWLEVAVTIHPVAHDALGAFLFDLGCSGIVLEDGQGGILKAYLPHCPDPVPLQHQLAARLHELGTIFPEAKSFQLNIRPIKNENWSLKWREHFRSQRITDHLVVYPAWEHVPQDGRDRVIRMDPGPAFGTGKHPTTQMCLEAMERISLPTNRGWTMLDVGTGSGILAIYGAMLGAQRIVAVDIDPEALRWARENARLNNVAQAIFFTDVPLAEVRELFTLVAANLSFTEITRLSHSFVRLMATGAWLVVSGILQDQLRETADSMEGGSLRLVKTLAREEWRCIVLQKGD